MEVEQPRDPASHAWFAFRTRGGLRERDLRLIAASMHSAMQVARRGPADVSRCCPLGRHRLRLLRLSTLAGWLRAALLCRALALTEQLGRVRVLDTARRRFGSCV